MLSLGFYISFGSTLITGENHSIITQWIQPGTCDNIVCGYHWKASLEDVFRVVLSQPIQGGLLDVEESRRRDPVNDNGFNLLGTLVPTLDPNRVPISRRFLMLMENQRLVGFQVRRFPM